ncbi:hypothetical protein JCGZ_17481 [Jatropha curcas]|uniref:Uncharacterized protein n=1 Tax=Jatropha curcas TaxID=180498 RepID=A0A067KEQ7_JATCU|nr:hypothetical protein JCGZ_17481 [Jatropha curcas]
MHNGGNPVVSIKSRSSGAHNRRPPCGLQSNLDYQVRNNKKPSCGFPYNPYHQIFLEYSFAEFGGRRKEIEGEEGGGGGGDATGEGEGINEEKEKEKRKEKKWAGPVRFELVRSDSVI